MDVLVHPSYREGLARALPQALLAKVPVISYDCDGAAEVCINNQTGLFVKTGDQSLLCKAMIDLANRPDFAAAMGIAGQHIALQKFSSTKMVDQILALYEHLKSRSK